MRPKFFLVYITTNVLNGSYYIGAHETYLVDDGYVGSGKRLKYAINKHGLANFRRRILRRCASRAEMYAYEKKVIGKHLGRKLCLNLAEGGIGGWSHVNKDVEKQRAHVRSIWLGRKHSDEAKAKIGAANSILKQGSGNPNFGKVWISHDVSQLVMSVQREFVEEYLNAGWRAGRCMRYESVKDWPL